MAVSLDQLAQYLSDDGRVDDALALLQRSLRIRLDLGDRPMLAEILGRLANVLAITGQAATAAKLLSRSAALREQIGSTSTPTVAKRNEETLAAIRGGLSEDELAQTWERGRVLTIDEAIALSLESTVSPT
jgi:tetratricopeptide (TPR) repeat protein